MKRLKFHRAIVAIAMMIIGWLPSLAHDFEVDGIFYNKLNSSKVAVTYKGNSYSSYSKEYIGDVVIPSSVNYNGTTYSVTSIGDEAFRSCYSLTSIEIPNSVTSIGHYAFEDCKSLTGIEIPNSVTWIGNYAFSDCRSLTSIEIPNSVTSIGEYAFYYCRSLTSIEIPNCVTWIGTYAFYYCESLTSVVIGNRVTSIGDYAFYGCDSLTSIEIPNRVTSIGDYAFYVCKSLTSIEIPNSVTSIGDYAFSVCSSLTSIVVDAGNTKYDSRNGCNAIIETASNTLIAGCQNTIIPNSVTSIGDLAFDHCDSLTSIEIPNSVTSIGDAAFYDCESLTSIEIGNSVTSIGNNAFAYCESLTSIEIPNSVTSIGDGAFYRCSGLTSVVIGNSVTSIGNEAFIGCTSLTEITCWATIPPTIELYTFPKCYADLYVSAGCMSAYQSAKYWKNFNITELPPILSNSITLDKYNANMKVGETITLNATILPENVTNKTVEWTSSDETIVVVDENGVVTAIAVGEATITATTVDGSNLSASCKVTVVPTLAVSIELNQTEASVEEKTDLQLTAIILPEHTTNKEVAWSSSDKWVAIVDNTGLVTMYSAGEAIITATTTDGTNLSATCYINVYSGINGVYGDEVIVATIGDNIVVKNAKLGSNVRVYATDGSIITSEIVTDGDVVVKAPVKGIYIVAVDSKTFKVMVK